MKKYLICLIAVLLILACNCGPRESNAKDNDIIAQVLELECEGRYFTVVDPMTDTLEMFHLPEKFTVDEHEFAPLIKKLIKRNKKPARLTLESSFVNNYVIIDFRKFRKIYYNGIYPFYRLLNIYPPIYCRFGISLPVYDEKEGIVLIYSGGGGFLIGRGDLIFYRLEDGKLREIKRLMLWLS